MARRLPSCLYTREVSSIQYSRAEAVTPTLLPAWQHTSSISSPTSSRHFSHAARLQVNRTSVPTRFERKAWRYRTGKYFRRMQGNQEHNIPVAPFEPRPEAESALLQQAERELMNGHQWEFAKEQARGHRDKLEIEAAQRELKRKWRELQGLKKASAGATRSARREDRARMQELMEQIEESKLDEAPELEPFEMMEEEEHDGVAASAPTQRTRRSVIPAAIPFAQPRDDQEYFESKAVSVPSASSSGATQPQPGAAPVLLFDDINARPFLHWSYLWSGIPLVAGVNGLSMIYSFGEFAGSLTYYGTIGMASLIILSGFGGFYRSTRFVHRLWYYPAGVPLPDGRIRSDPTLHMIAPIALPIRRGRKLYIAPDVVQASRPFPRSSPDMESNSMGLSLFERDPAAAEKYLDIFPARGRDRKGWLRRRVQWIGRRFGKVVRYGIKWLTPADDAEQVWISFGKQRWKLDAGGRVDAASFNRIVARRRTN